MKLEKRFDNDSNTSRNKYIRNLAQEKIEAIRFIAIEELEAREFLLELYSADTIIKILNKDLPLCRHYIIEGIRSVT